MSPAKKAQKWPKHGKLSLIVEDKDVIITSYTDSRGYVPTFCGKDNANKTVFIIIKEDE